MGFLLVAAALWLAVHLGLSGTPLRDGLIGAIGERAFRGVFSLLALAALVLLIFAYRGAGGMPLWTAPAWFVVVVDAVMLVALLLLAGGLIPPRGSGEGARGTFRITRHPLMSAIGLWSGAHLLANGDTASLVFFGTFLLTVLAGVPSADGKLSRRDPAKAAALHAATSRLPFAAILAGRNRIVLAEIGWLPPIAGVIAWAVLMYLHPLVLGVPALPVW